MINDIIRRLEEYLGILKEIKEREPEIVDGLTKQGQQDLYYRNITEIYSGLLKMEKRMALLRQLKIFIRRR